MPKLNGTSFLFFSTYSITAFSEFVTKSNSFKSKPVDACSILLPPKKIGQLDFKETAACVREIRQTLKSNCPIFLGGSNIEHVSTGLDLKEFDLVTSSLNAVIEYVEKNRKEVPLSFGMAAEG
jgi:hypothetical protein